MLRLCSFFLNTSLNNKHHTTHQTAQLTFLDYDVGVRVTCTAFHTEVKIAFWRKCHRHVTRLLGNDLTYVEPAETVLASRLHSPSVPCSGIYWVSHRHRWHHCCLCWHSSCSLPCTASVWCKRAAGIVGNDILVNFVCVSVGSRLLLVLIYLKFSPSNQFCFQLTKTVLFSVLLTLPSQLTLRKGHHAFAVILPLDEHRCATFMSIDEMCIKRPTSHAHILFRKLQQKCT